MTAERRVSTAVRLPETLHEQLRAAAAERQVSVNLLITRAVADYLKRLIPVEDACRARVGDTP